MKPGVWHQCGARSQLLVQEQLMLGNGIGVIISPRDLSLENACDYSQKYRDLDAEVIIDLQLYNPQFRHKLLSTYQMNDFRVGVSSLCKLNNIQLQNLKSKLSYINGSIRTTAVLAPAIIYEAGRDDIVELNAQLFSIAKNVGDDLGIPTYATILIGKSAIVSENSISSIMSYATNLNCDGWYYGFEFSQNRIPNTYEDILKFGASILTLAGTGKPIIHSFSGPLSLVSMGFGATGTALGHSQNLWQFTKGRWETPKKKPGGNGRTPPRYFSKNLWGTFVYPDEFKQIPQDLRQRLMSNSPFSSQINPTTLIPWEKWDAGKHMVYIIGKTITEQLQFPSIRDRANFAISLLGDAIQLGQEVQKNLKLKDETCCYQENWKKALETGLSLYENDFEYLSLL